MKTNGWERVHVTLTRTGTHILFCTFPHKFICRDHENKGNLTTRNICSSFTVSFIFLCFCFKKPTCNYHESFVIFKLFTQRNKMFCESHPPEEKGLPSSKINQDSYTPHKMNLLKIKITTAMVKPTVRNKK